MSRRKLYLAYSELAVVASLLNLMGLGLFFVICLLGWKLTLFTLSWFVACQAVLFVYVKDAREVEMQERKRGR